MDHMGVIYGRIAKLCKKSGRWNIVEHHRVKYAGESLIPYTPWTHTNKPGAGPTYAEDPDDPFGHKWYLGEISNRIIFEQRWECKFTMHPTDTRPGFIVGIDRVDETNYFLRAQYDCFNATVNNHNNLVETVVQYHLRRDLSNPKAIPRIVKMSKEARNALKTCVCDPQDHAYIGSGYTYTTAYKRINVR